MQFKIETTSNYNYIYNDWARLYSLTPKVSPFLQPDAMRIAQRYFYPYYISRKALPYFMIFKENGVIRAIIPFLRYQSGLLQLFGDANGFNESGFVYDSADLLPDIYYSLRVSGRTIEFIKIDARSPIASFRPSDSTPTSNAEIYFGDNHNDYISTLSKSVRQNIRTAYNRLNTDGLFIDVKVVKGGGSFPIDEVIGLYCRRHSERYGVKTGLLKRWFLKSQNFATRYYRFSPNALTVIIYISGKPAAFLSGLFNEDRLIVPRLSIDKEYQRYSPGMLLVVETIKHLQSNTKIRALDLSQGNESYKYQLGAVEHLSYRFKL